MTDDLPDFHGSVGPIRTTLGSNQAKYIITAAGAIVSGGSGTLDVTVASGKRQTFSLITAESPASVIQEFDISINDTIFWRQHYDVHGETNFPPEGAIILSAGEKLTVTIINNDTVTQTLRLNIAGTIEDA